MIKDGFSVGYSRVSTKKQDVDKYTHYFERYEKRTGSTIDKVVLEKVSATKVELKKRMLWALLHDESVKTIVIPNASRCVRSIRDAVKIIDILQDFRKDLSIIIEDRRLILNHETSSEDENYFYELVITASRETSQRSETIKLGLSRRKEAGFPLGGNRTRKLEKHKNRIFSLLSQGVSKTFIANSLGVNPSTLFRFLKKEEEDILKEFGYTNNEYKYDFKSKNLVKRNKK